MEFDDLVCLSDIAKILGVSRQRASQIQRQLPKPLGRKGYTMLWLKSDIFEWRNKKPPRYYQRYFPKEYKPYTKQEELFTPREMRVLLGYVNKNKNIAAELGIKNSTVDVILQKIRRKLGAARAKEIAQKALELGLISDEPAIVTNRIRCKHCGDIIESTHVHDFKTCSCGRVSVDGGHEYLRRVFKEDGDFEELSTFEEAK